MKTSNNKLARPGEPQLSFSRMGVIFLSLAAGYFLSFFYRSINAMIARFAEGPMAFWYWPILSVGAILSFWPLNLLMNMFGALFVLVTVIHSHIRNSAAAHPKT